LQTFATQEKLKEFASVVEIINVQRHHMTFKGKLIGKLRKFGILGMAEIPTFFRQKYVFGQFERQYLNVTNDRYADTGSFDTFIFHDGLYFTGSDQVWNPSNGGALVEQMCLSFVPEEKRKFSFSSSFGTDTLSTDEAERIKKFIAQYERISVREDSGLKILREQLSYHNCIQLVDPTLAMPPEFWRKYAPKSKTKPHPRLKPGGS